MKKGPRILIFTGDGKGKTTAALGMALRAAGHGMHIYVIQFIKNALTGEILAVKNIPNIEISQTGLGFLPSAEDERFTAHRQGAQAGLDQAAGAIESGNYSLIILDEICLAVSRGLLEEGEVIELLQKVLPDSCVVLTGRGATENLIALADTVTEMRCLKHGLELGFSAQKGVEL
ncbi:MAG: cob(I)yrinic acid a,c-diamide adenosyltransferase [Phycisphaerae bacterium]